MDRASSSRSRAPASAVRAACCLFVLSFLGTTAESSRAGILRRVPTQYPTIAAALAAAAAGDTVGVMGGSYSESFAARNAVHVFGGYSPTFAVRDPALYETVLFMPGRVMTAGSGVTAATVIDGLTFRGGNGDTGGLVSISGGSPTVSHCRFEDAVGGRGGAVYIAGSASHLENNVFTGCASSEVGGALAIFSANNVVVDGCEFIGNVSASSGGAVFLNQAMDILFANCVFKDNQSGAHGGAILVQFSRVDVVSSVFARNAGANGGAVGVYSPSASTVGNCTFAVNTAASGTVYVNEGGRLTITNSIIARGTGSGLVATPTSIVTNSCNDVWLNTPANYVNVIAGANSFAADPVFCDEAADNWTLRDDSPCTPENAPACGLIGALNALCSGEYLRVPDDYATIALALNAAAGGDTVAVAEGVYAEHVTLKRNVRLLGGFRSDFALRDPLAYPSVIDAGQFLSAVVAQNSEGPLTTIDGFVIRGGNRTNDVGGGIHCFNASPTISNNVFVGNRAMQGAAIGCRGAAAPAIVGNLIVDNVTTAGPGGAIYVEAPARIEGNTLDRNTGPLAAGIAARFGARPVVRRNIVVRGVTGVGIYADEGAAPETSCNDVWMNAGGDYFGVLPGPSSFSLDPLFCEFPDRFLREDSPCAPAHAPAPCGLIGARPTGCAVAGLEPAVVGPATNRLGRAAPNPFFAATVLAFDLAREADVRLVIYDSAGRAVRELLGARLSAGAQRSAWDGRDDRGRPVSAGVYFYELIAAGERIGREKLVLLR